MGQLRRVRFNDVVQVSSNESLPLLSACKPLYLATSMPTSTSPTTAPSHAGEVADSDPNTAAQAQPRDVVLFFLSGVGASIAWTSVLSNLVYYTATLGTHSYLILNLSVYAPLLPITVAQARYDASYDRMYGSMKSFSCRGLVGFAVTTTTVCLLPLASGNLLALSILTMFLGLASAILLGTLNQMASFVYPGCGRLPAATTSGMQASGVLVLAASLVTGFGSSANSLGLATFYLCIALLAGLCWSAFHLLMAHSRPVNRSMIRRDSSIMSVSGMALIEVDVDVEWHEESNQEKVSSTSVSAMALVDVDAGAEWHEESNQEKVTGTNDSEEHREQIESLLPSSSRNTERDDRDMTFRELWDRAWICCVALILTVSSSMSVASWFNQVKSANPEDTSLPVVLFYTRLFADLLGRPATLLLPPRSMSLLGIVAVVRLLFVPLFFLYVSSGNEHLLPRSDAAVIIGVALFAFSSGFIVTGCYQIAPKFLPEHSKEVNFTKQASLINVCFSTSILVGLGVSFTLLGVGV